MSRPHAAEQVLCALFGADGKLRAAEVADHQSVSGQHEPGLVGAGAIAHEKTNVLRRVARRVQHLRRDVAERKHLVVAYAPLKGNETSASRREHILGAGRLGELPACREMVGMNMGVDDEVDAHAGGFGGAQ